MTNEDQPQQQTINWDGITIHQTAGQIVNIHGLNAVAGARFGPDTDEEDEW